MEDHAEEGEATNHDLQLDLFNLTEAATLIKIYSYTILGGEEVKSIQIISSCSSKTFENEITNIDFEQLLLSMSESLAKN